MPRAGSSFNCSAPSCSSCGRGSGSQIRWSTSTWSVSARSRIWTVPCRRALTRTGGGPSTVLQHRSEVAQGWPAIHCLNSSFFNRLCNSGGGGGGAERNYNYEYVRTWTRRVDLFSKGLVIIPVNLDNVHWALAVAILADRHGTGANHGQLLYLDSNQDNSHRGAAEVMDLLKRYFADEVSPAHNQTSGSVSLERRRLGGAVGRQEEVLPAVSSVALVSRLPSCVRPLGSSFFTVRTGSREAGIPTYHSRQTARRAVFSCWRLQRRSQEEWIQGSSRGFSEPAIAMVFGNRSALMSCAALLQGPERAGSCVEGARTVYFVLAVRVNSVTQRPFPRHTQHASIFHLPPPPRRPTEPNGGFAAGLLSFGLTLPNGLDLIAEGTSQG